MWCEARMGSHQGPIPTSASSPAPTIHRLGGPLRRIVGASGERMRWSGPLNPVWGTGIVARPMSLIHLNQWAPDSRRLLFLSDREEEKNQLWLIDPHGINP